MATQRTVTKVIFHDSSDDEDNGASKTKGATTTTTFVDVRTDTLCMDEDDMVDPEEHFKRTEDIVGGADDLFVEDALPDLEKAKGTLSINHSNSVEVEVMAAPSRRAHGYNADGSSTYRNARPGRRPEDATSAHSTRKRLRDDDDEDEVVGGGTAAANTADEGMTTDEMLSAATAHGLPTPAPNSTAMAALDAIEEEVVKAVLLPNGTNRDPIAIKVSSEGYRLTLDEHDVQDVFEDGEEGEEDEEEDEDDEELQLLMAVSAIEQMIGACERYAPNEEDGGMCPWAEEEEEAKKKETAATEETPSSSAATAVPAAAAASSAAAAAEPEQPKRIVHRPRIFDEFVVKGKDLLQKMQNNEITANELCEAMEDDIEQLQKAFRRINRPMDQAIYIDGVKMDL